MLVSFTGTNTNWLKLTNTNWLNWQIQIQINKYKLTNKNRLKLTNTHWHKQKIDMNKKLTQIKSWQQKITYKNWHMQIDINKKLTHTLKLFLKA